MCTTPEGYHYFLNHVKQRLVIILDYNIPNGLDPCPSDILLMREMYDLYDKGSVDTFSDVEVQIDTVQQSLFNTPEAQDHERDTSTLHGTRQPDSEQPPDCQPEEQDCRA